MAGMTGQILGGDKRAALELWKEHGARAGRSPAFRRALPRRRAGLRERLRELRRTLRSEQIAHGLQNLVDEILRTAGVLLALQEMPVEQQM